MSFVLLSAVHVVLVSLMCCCAHSGSLANIGNAMAKITSSKESLAYQKFKVSQMTPQSN